MGTAFTPTNEQGVVYMFGRMAESLGFELVEIGVAFPDAVVRYQGVEYRVEFEYRASNFIMHGHDPDGCDIIICWINNVPDMPIPILELSEPDGFTVQPVDENEYLRFVNKWLREALRDKRLRQRPRAKDAKKEKVTQYVMQNPEASASEIAEATRTTEQYVRKLRREAAQNEVSHESLT